jgi:hypothetical protein
MRKSTRRVYIQHTNICVYSAAMGDHTEIKLDTFSADKGYVRLPAAGKRLIEAYAETGDLDKLFSSIKINVETQKTNGGRIVRASQFVGLLKRTPFELTVDELEPIQVSDGDYKKYNSDLNKNFMDNQHESTISLGLFNSLVICCDLSYLLMVSGRRVSELTDSKWVFDIDGNAAYCELMKSRDSTPKLTKVYLLSGDVVEFQKRYLRFKSDETKQPASALNHDLKTIIPDGVYKRSSHIYRTLYARYIYQFRNPSRKTLSQIIAAYLGHNSVTSSGHYQHIVFSSEMIDVFYEYRTVGQLRYHASLMDLRIPSNLRKSEIINRIVSKEMEL